jgi:hypothetical protein
MVSLSPGQEDLNFPMSVYRPQPVPVTAVIYANSKAVAAIKAADGGGSALAVIASAVAPFCRAEGFHHSGRHSRVTGVLSQTTRVVAYCWTGMELSGTMLSPVMAVVVVISSGVILIGNNITSNRWGGM